MKAFDNVAFGVKITVLRKESDMPQAKLAELTGITQQTLSRYEKGERQASLDFVINAADVFGVSTDFLLGKTDIRSAKPDIKTACEVTGLSEKAIKNIQLTFDLLEDYERTGTTKRAILEDFLESNFFISVSDSLTLAVMFKIKATIKREDIDLLQEEFAESIKHEVENGAKVETSLIYAQMAKKDFAAKLAEAQNKAIEAEEKYDHDLRELIGTVEAYIRNMATDYISEHRKTYDKKKKELSKKNTQLFSRQIKDIENAITSKQEVTDNAQHHETQE